ncbi:MAG: hypothetical protein AUJ98_08510 [Bacteroidetes bacterium CG2_30_33_31]|nr:MAG: hypothetical protein AUJ98_08510 [Bacteroidetes bacterium CG2_30_33_31]
MKDDKSNIGKAFSEAFKDFKIEPEPQVWANISNKITLKKGGFSMNKYLSIGIISLIIVAVLSIIILNNDRNKNVINDSAANTNVISNQLSNTHINQEKNTISEKIANNNSVNNNSVNNNSVKENEKLLNKHTSENSPIVSTEKILEVKNKIDNNLQIKTESTPIQITKMKASSIASNQKLNENIETENYTSNNEMLLNEQNISEVKFSNDPTICFGEDAGLKILGGKEYRWSNGNNSSEILVQPVSNSTYSVTVTDKDGSSITHNFNITIDKECTAVFVPSAFSPNGDGNNDVFKALGENILEFEMQIMNRQGKIVFSSKDINFGWNGKLNGSLAPSEVYVYNIIYKNGRGEQSVKKGQFTLIK